MIWEFDAKYRGIDPNVDFSPLNVLESWEKESDSLAKKGLREGLRDSLTGLKYLPDDIKAELNDNLISENYPSINILTSQIINLPKRVLKKGKIKNLDEYYVIKEVLDDMEYEITDSQRAELNRIFVEFERNYNEKNAS